MLQGCVFSNPVLEHLAYMQTSQSMDSRTIPKLNGKKSHLIYILGMEVNEELSKTMDSLPSTTQEIQRFNSKIGKYH